MMRAVNQSGIPTVKERELTKLLFRTMEILYFTPKKINQSGALRVEIADSSFIKH